MNRAIPAATDKGAAFLLSVQLEDGSFESFSSPSASPFRPNITYRTTFTSAIILGALSTIKHEDIARIREHLATWLLTQKSAHWAFNYWAQDAPEQESMPYPDDLDDTFCALIALQRHDPSLITGASLAEVVKLLVATETKVGGPYRTWLVPKTADAVWQDVDLAVNSNIATFLKSVAEPLPNLSAIMHDAIETHTFYSPYYPSSYPTTYYIARAIEGSDAPELVRYLARRQREGWWGSCLRSALAVSALIQLGEVSRCKPAIKRLVERQLPDGSWPAEAFCLDPAIEGRRHFGGAAALTTALVLEALNRYVRTLPAVVDPSRAVKLDRASETFQTQVMSAAQREINLFDPTLRCQSLHALERIKPHDTSHKIVLLPRFFNLSTLQPLSAKHAPLLKHLALANLYGWTAYTIFDDFLDDEGRPSQLPVGTTMLRYSLKHFREALPEHQQFQQLLSDTFDIIDSANSWETIHARFAIAGDNIVIGHIPAYGNRRRLAERSLGHTLTPLAILAASGVPLNSAHADNVQKALKHYLIARQLSDDLHDWEDDFRAGRATYVVATILRELSISAGSYPIETLLPKMRQRFWRQTVVHTCQIISDHNTKARAYAQTSTLLKRPNIITSLIDAIDAVVKETLSEQANAEQFLKTYRKSI